MASAALEDVKTAALPARAKTQVAELKRRLSALERSADSGDKASATGQANRSPKATTSKGKATANWGTEVAAIDKALTTLLGPENTTGATPSATGTSGTTAPPASRNKAAANITLDAETRASLLEVRKHVTAYATAMAGGKTETHRDDATMSEPAAPASATPATTPPAAAQPPSSQTPTGEPPATQPPAQQQPTQSPTQQTEPTSGQTPTGAPEEEARRHLTEARNTLSALTQLPAAAQLSGEARTQIAQLISNFNDLITTQSEWRESYAKVTANLASLLGPGAGAAGATGTAGAVGTSGTASADLDPAVREKLMDLRRNLSAFERAATGGAAGMTPTGATAPTGTTPPAGTTSPTGAMPQPDTTRPATSSATAPSTAPATPATTTEPAHGRTGAQATAGNADVMRHVAAIETLLKMQDDSGGLTLTKAQVEQLRTHWTALRQALDKK